MPDLTIYAEFNMKIAMSSYTETQNLVQSDTVALPGTVNIGKNAKSASDATAAALVWLARIADLMRRLAELDGVGGYGDGVGGSGSARAVFAVVGQWLGEDARSGLAALGHDASDDAAPGDGQGTGDAVDLAALGRAIDGITATIDGLRRAAEGSTPDAGAFQLVLRAIVPCRDQAVAAARIMGVVEGGAGWTRRRLIDACYAHADWFGPDSLKSLNAEFDVKKAIDVDPARWADFCIRAAAGTPLAA